MRRLGGFALSPLLALAALSCGQDTDSPVEPTMAPAVEAAPTPLSFRQVSASSGISGDIHACGVTTDDRAYCWGSNLWGQLGIGNSSGPEDCGNPCSRRPVAVLGDLRFKHVSAG